MCRCSGPSYLQGEALTDSFATRMAALDALVEHCRGNGAFKTGTVRDASNRSSRDWLWWGIQIEQTREDGAERRRAIATISINEEAPDVPSLFKARWQARVWRDANTDIFRRQDEWPLTWSDPSPQELDDTMAELLDRANAAISEAIG